MTFEAANQTRRCERNRQISYGRNELHHLGQKLILLEKDVGPPELGDPPRYVPTVPNV